MHNAPMIPDWRDRLRQAWEASGRSKRDISLSAGLNANFLHEIFHMGKCPSVDNLIVIARELNVSASELIQ